MVTPRPGRKQQPPAPTPHPMLGSRSHVPRRPATPRPTLLVDAYNVLHVTGILPPEVAGPDAPALARLVARSRYGGRGCWLVCDGAPPGSRRSGGMLRLPAPGVERVELVYAGPNRDADSLIERLIERDSAPRKLLVVSSDRRILTAARKRKCSAMPSEAFLSHLAHDHAHPRSSAVYPEFALDVPLDPTETKRWRDRLGLAGFDVPASPDPLAKNKKKTPAPNSPAPPAEGKEPTNKPPDPPTDPLLKEALREWDGRLDLDELDMSRWLGDSD